MNAVANLALVAVLSSAFTPGLAPSDIAALRQPLTRVPAGSLPNLAGGTLSLRNNDGHPTVLVVFGSWCDPCRENMPAIVNLARTSSARFIGIDELESIDAARAFVAASKVTFPTVLLSAPAFSGPSVTDEQRGSTGVDIPAAYIIDSQGRSYKAFVGKDALFPSNISAALRDLARHPP
jgi:thiol-disulfide isomerase/thioredoxin